MNKPLRPAEHAEHLLLEAILNQEYAPGSALPAERVLATTLGVTRPTLRETLQRLSSKGWITISQGKPTRVNDYLNNGGLALLGSMLSYGKGLSTSMVEHLLQMRSIMLPGIARLAAGNDSAAISDYLKKMPDVDQTPLDFAEYDWALQSLVVTLSGNPVFRFMFNDFTPIYHGIGELYFQDPLARQNSLAFYQELVLSLEQGEDRVEQCVKNAMETSITIWKSRRKDGI
ncbi:MAG: GntR family transcriptional regulator [Desulfobacterium sp.]|nr:GntR family transcriptional regulator [Desulfobacterium sp.]